MKGLLLSIVLCVFVSSAVAQSKYRMPFPEPIQSQQPVEGMLLDRPFGYYNLTTDGGHFALIIGYQYESAHGFIASVGLARVKQGGKWGYIGIDGYPVVKCIYDDARDFDNNGYAMVKRDGKWGVIDNHGDASVPCVYDTMSDHYNGWFEVSKGDVWGYVSNTGIYAASYSEYEKKQAELGKSE